MSMNMTDEEIQEYIGGMDLKLKGKFEGGGDAARSSKLQKAERHASYTLPRIFLQEHEDESTEIHLDAQSVGAQAVTNLANKLMLAMFPPSRPFFRSNLSPEQIGEIMAAGLSQPEIEESLAEAERTAMRNLEARSARSVLTDAMLHLIIVGTVMLHVPKDGKSKITLYGLRDFSVKRNRAGDLLEGIIRDGVAVSTLPAALASICAEKGRRPDDTVNLYTGVRRLRDGRYVVWQELEDYAFAHEAHGVYPADELEWLALDWNRASGHSYGTSLVEDYAGDFHTLSTLAEGIVNFTAIALDVKKLVNPAGQTDVKALNKAPPGSYVTGREGDVVTLKHDVFDATAFLENQFEAVRRRIATAFLMNSVVTRDAERVTAEEIRMQAMELDRSYGGVYARMGQDLQMPLAKRHMADLAPEFKDIKPVIVTGLESLSRGSELDNWRAFLGDLTGTQNIPPPILDRIKLPALIAVLATGHGVDSKKVLLSEDEFQQMMAQRAQQQAQEAGAVAGAEAQATGEIPQ